MTYDFIYPRSRRTVRETVSKHTAAIGEKVSYFFDYGG